MRTEIININSDCEPKFGKIDIGKYANGMMTTFQKIGKAIGDLFNNPAFQEGFASMINSLINFSAMAQPVIQSVISTLGKIIPPIICTG